MKASAAWAGTISIQEGAAALCKAATYDGTSAQFGTYATAVVRNHLLNCCKSVNAGQRNLPAVSLDDCCSDDGRPPPCPEPSTPDGVDELIGRLDAADLLADCKRRYTGVARLGVEEPIQIERRAVPAEDGYEIPIRIYMVLYKGFGHAYFDNAGVCPQTEDRLDEMAAFVQEHCKD